MVLVYGLCLFVHLTMFQPIMKRKTMLFHDLITSVYIIGDIKQTLVSHFTLFYFLMKLVNRLRACHLALCAGGAVHAETTLQDGDVFGLLIVSPRSEYSHLKPVLTLADGTLAFSNFDGSAKEFRGVKF